MDVRSASEIGRSEVRRRATRVLRAVRRRGTFDPLEVSAGDPLNYCGILTPEDRVAAGSKAVLVVA